MDAGLFKAAFLLLAGIGFMVMSSELRSNIARFVGRHIHKSNKPSKDVIVN